jgi:hypothetical protein
MIRVLHIMLFAIVPAVSFGQGEVGYLIEEFPDSLRKRTLKTHSSLKPSIRQSSQQNYFKATVLGDLNFAVDSSSHFRTGAGLELTSSINNKWYFRLAGVQGAQNRISNISSNAYFESEEPDIGLYADIRSRIAYTPNEVFNFQIGLDHNFIGEGARSMFLSDYGKPYPFGLIRTKFWRIEYSVLYQFMREQEVSNSFEAKFASSHHISFNVAEWLNIGVFESVVFQPRDTSLRRGFDVEYLNPMVFYRPQEYSLGSSDNVLLGVEASAFVEDYTIYGQFIIDEFNLAELRARTGWWANKFGGQLGIKKNNMSKGLFYRLEYNFARPYTFAHVSEELNYGNQGAALGHPYGANFMEILGEIKYSLRDWKFTVFGNYYVSGTDRDGYNYGTNIYLPYTNRPSEYDHYIGQGTQLNGLNAQARILYKVLDYGNLHAFAEYNLGYTHQFNMTDHHLVFGVRSLLWNNYRNY